jgi:hypothetical protein
MTKKFNNIAGTTSSDFSIGVGSTKVRHIVLGANCSGSNVLARDKEGNEIEISGVEFFDLRMLAKDQAGNIATKQIRGSVLAGGAVYKIEDVFQEASGADVTLTINGTTLSINCARGSSPSIVYSIYISLLRAS